MPDKDTGYLSDEAIHAAAAYPYYRHEFENYRLIANAATDAADARWQELLEDSDAAAELVYGAMADTLAAKDAEIVKLLESMQEGTKLLDAASLALDEAGEELDAQRQRYAGLREAAQEVVQDHVWDKRIDGCDKYCTEAKLWAIGNELEGMQWVKFVAHLEATMAVYFDVVLCHMNEASAWLKGWYSLTEAQRMESLAQAVKASSDT